MQEFSDPFEIINSNLSWVEIHNALLRMGHEDPQLLVDALLKIWGDPNAS
tara:strand:- start:2680 stop:2829 length:150 start_codon:yes stop_codon:yes gene_type:complete